MAWELARVRCVAAACLVSRPASLRARSNALLISSLSAGWYFRTTSPPLNVGDEPGRLALSRERASGCCGGKDASQKAAVQPGVAESLHSPQVGGEQSPRTFTRRCEQVLGDSPPQFPLLVRRKRFILEELQFQPFVRLESSRRQRHSGAKRRGDPALGPCGGSAPLPVSVAGTWQPHSVPGIESLRPETMGCAVVHASGAAGFILVATGQAFAASIHAPDVVVRAEILRGLVRRDERLTRIRLLARTGWRNRSGTWRFGLWGFGHPGGFRVPPPTARKLLPNRSCKHSPGCPRILVPVQVPWIVVTDVGLQHSLPGSRTSALPVRRSAWLIRAWPARLAQPGPQWCAQFLTSLMEASLAPDACE